MKLEISGVHMDLEDDLKKYVTKKMNRLEKYIPRHARESAAVNVTLKESHAKNKRQFTCEINLSLPLESINVSESTLNIFAAVDIAEETAKNRLKRYKEKKVSDRSGNKDRKVRILLGKILSKN
jgi:ribosomal subunit interface protein